MMLYSVNYLSKRKEEADEIRCPYNQLGQIFTFIKDNPNKRFLISIPSDIAPERLTKAKEQIEFVKDITDNYVVQCSTIPHYNELREGSYKAFLRYPVSDWETFQQLKKLGVSDIYIDGALGFQVKELKKGKEDINIRCSPTISPNLIISSPRDPSSFFIRPEDLVFYDDIIDIIDFHVNNQTQEDALFSIYKQEIFLFDINKLIKGLPAGVNNQLIKSDFAKTRLNCGQKCQMPSRTCRYCNSTFSIINHIQDYSKH